MLVCSPFRDIQKMLAKLLDLRRKSTTILPQILVTPLTLFSMVLCAYLCMAWFDQGYAHPDEHFQILELATYKNHSCPNGVPWEFHEEIRPTIQVWFVILLIKILSFFLTEAPPLLLAFLTKAFAAILSATSCFAIYISFKDELNTSDQKKWFFLFLAFNCVTFCHASHFSSEVISADFFMIGLSLLFYKQTQIKHIRYFFIGCLLGAAFITRYQTGLMLFGLIAWLMLFQKISLKNFFFLLCGIGLVVLFGVILDTAFFGHFICTAWRYFNFNLVKGYAAGFGTSHWTYFHLLYTPLFGPLYILGPLYFMRKKPTHVITWVMLPFLFIHQLIGHKELRFMLPLMGFIPFILFYDLQMLQSNSKYQYLKNRVKKWNPIIWYINTILILFHIFSHYHPFVTYHYLWQNHRNQTTILYRYYPPKDPNKDVSLLPPYEFYLPNNIRLKNYSDFQSSSPHSSYLQLVWVTCDQQFPFTQNTKLIYDSCPTGKIGAMYNNYKWPKRSFIFRHIARIYQL